DTLTERGFVHQTGNKLERPNRLLAKYLEERPNEATTLARLFGSPASYEQHFKSALELRIAQLNSIDATLRQYLQRRAEDLPDHPDIFLSNVRGIVNQAFELIWKAELGKKTIPSAWMAIWKYNNERGIEEWQTTFPQGVHRARLLQLMTGTDKSKPCAK